ncbi:MAG TPA: c-type cytochrome [Bryobacteraceae bacterium]|nr:c-type cytochrome [Bryobacteraceae bacterium]
MTLSLRLLSTFCAFALLTAAAPKTGRELFETNCSMCHGKDGTGGHGGANLRDGLKYGRDVKSISNVIAHGIPSNGMPSFASHSPAEIHKLAEYVLTLHRQGQARIERGSAK